MTLDPRKRNKKEAANAFMMAYELFKKDNKGFHSVLDFIENEYGGEKAHWAKSARWAGFKCYKRNGTYFFEA